MFFAQAFAACFFVLKLSHKDICNKQMMQWIDYIVLVYLVMHFVKGTRKGLFSIMINSVCFLVSLVLSFYTYEYSANYLVSSFGINETYANIISFFANMFIFKILLIIIVRFLMSGKIVKMNDSSLNKILGGIASFAYGAIIVILIFSITLSFSLPYFIDKEFRTSETGKIVSANPLGMNDGIKKIFGGVLSTTIDALSFLTISENENDKKIDLGFSTSDYKISETSERDMLNMVNNERKANGLDGYVIDEKLRDVARLHAKDMFEKGYFSHTNLLGEKPADRMKKGGVGFNFSGENLAYSKDLLSAHQGLMNSEGHRKNILHPLFHRIGIGVVDAGARGMIFVQDFAD